MNDLRIDSPAALSTPDSTAIPGRPDPAVPADRSWPTRRKALGLAGLAVGGVTLAACGSGGGTAGTTSFASAPASASPAAGGGSDSVAPLAKLSDVAVGSAVSATLKGQPIIVGRPTADQAVAFSAICPHAGCVVAPKGAELDCPCHGSKFNATTGAVLNGPAVKSLTAVAVTVKDGEVIPA